MAQTVIGLFQNDSDAQRASESLQSAGISSGNIDVSRGTGGGSDMVSNDSDRGERESGIERFFKNLFGDDNDDADRYTKVSTSGRYSIVTVHAQSSDEAERAADMLDELGAVNVDESASQHGYQSQGASGNYDRNTGSGSTMNTAGNMGSDRSTYTDLNLNTNRGMDSDRDSDTTINRVEENLQVGKREVERGGVRVRSRIVERPVEETLRLREEHVRVERNPVNRAVTDGDNAAFESQDISLTERAEVPVVNKESRVVEEIHISKDVDERVETVRDTVRNTEVDIDQMDTNNTSRRDSDTGNMGSNNPGNMRDGNNL